MAKRTHNIGDAPIQGDLYNKMNELARALQTVFNGEGCRISDSKVGFILISFNLGDTTRANYISNAQRDDIIAMLKELVSRFEGMPEVKLKTKQ